MSGTIVVFSEDPRLRERVCAVIPSLPAATDVLLAWEAFAVAAPASLCAIVCIEHLGPSGKYAELCGLKRMNPLLPIVLVTARTAENARWLKDGNVEEVVWSVELDVDLSPAVVAAVARSWRERAARAVEGAGHLSPRLRRAIAEAFRRPKPPRTVASLARLAGCDRRTLWQDWRQAGVPLTLQYLIEWRLLVAAAEHKRPGKKWNRVAEDLGIDARTITRLTQKLAGLESRRELAQAGLHEVLLRFTDAVLEPLVGTGGADELSRLQTDWY